MRTQLRSHEHVSGTHTRQTPNRPRHANELVRSRDANMTGSGCQVATLEARSPVIITVRHPACLSRSNCFRSQPTQVSRGPSPLFPCYAAICFLTIARRTDTSTAPATLSPDAFYLVLPVLTDYLGPYSCARSTTAAANGAHSTT